MRRFRPKGCVPQGATVRATPIRRLILATRVAGYSYPATVTATAVRISVLIRGIIDALRALRHREIFAYE
jgi:hypothetical protein